VGPSYIYRSSPVFVGGSAWENLAVAKFGGLCTKTDGTLWSWGTGSYGQPGQGNTSNRSFPQQIGALTNWSKPAIGGANYNGGPVFCIKTNGTLFSWGFNNNGQLGQGNTVNRSSPTQVGALTTWATIKSGYFNAVATKTDGTLWTWGRGSHGQLGLGNTTQ
jgi:alpha-tubulin suppressor-like RCC1 family protein